MIHKILKWCFVAIVPLLTACSTDYVNVIPQGSTALLSINPTSVGSGVNDAKLLAQLLHIDNVEDCGIDLSERLYAFEAPDGSLGAVARVSSASDLETLFNDLSKTGLCTKLTERKGFKFTVVHGSFVAGFSDDALLIMGPSVGAAQAELQNTMAKYLKADEDDGIRETEMFERLEQMQGAVNVVAQAQAFPDNIAAPLTLGAPKGTSPTDVYIAASMELKGDGVVCITGENFSFNDSVDKALKAAAAQYVPITETFVKSISSTNLFTMICGVNGEEYIKQLRSNEAFRTMLLGLNTAIDIDMMLKSVKGDMLISVPQTDGDKIDFQMVAQTGNSKWLDDVAYWKTSCPDGSKIIDWQGKRSFHFTSTDWNVYFGLNQSDELFFGSSEQLATTAGQQSATPVSQDVQQMVLGKRLCLVVSLQAIAKAKPEAQTALALLRPMFGDIKTIIYSIK